MKKTTVIALILVSLMTLGMVVIVQPVHAQAQKYITINADGSITPSSAPLQRVGNLYTLASDENECISVQRNGATLDGNGRSISAIQLDGVINVTVRNFLIMGGGEVQNEHTFAGISLIATSNSIVANNSIIRIYNFLDLTVWDELVVGIFVANSSSNIISANNLVNNWRGMFFQDASYNLIVENNIIYNSTDHYGYGGNSGISFQSASNNTIYHNNFEVNTGQEAGDSYFGSVNVWDYGFPLGGNYWINYLTRYLNVSEIGTSGIGNTSYFIDSLESSYKMNNTDRYPLMEPLNSTFSALQATPPRLSVMSPLSKTYRNSNVSLAFSVAVLSPVKTVNWAGYSLDGEPNITIPISSAAANITIGNMTNGRHQITIYANDTYGNTAAPQTINFTIAKPEPFPTMTVATVLGAVAVIVVVAVLWVYFKKRKR